MAALYGRVHVIYIFNPSIKRAQGVEDLGQLSKVAYCLRSSGHHKAEAQQAHHLPYL
jgi:hypothetical protein